MKDFRFAIKKNSHTINSKSFEDFTDSLVQEVNNNQSIIEQAKKANREYYKMLSNTLADMKEDDDCYTYWSVKDIAHKIPRYTYYEKVEFQGVKYDVKIDLLDWTAELIEITD